MGCFVHVLPLCIERWEDQCLLLFHGQKHNLLVFPCVLVRVIEDERIIRGMCFCQDSVGVSFSFHKDECFSVISLLEIGLVLKETCIQGGIEFL